MSVSHVGGSRASLGVATAICDLRFGSWYHRRPDFAGTFESVCLSLTLSFCIVICGNSIMDTREILPDPLDYCPKVKND